MQNFIGLPIGDIFSFHRLATRNILSYILTILASLCLDWLNNQNHKTDNITYKKT